MCTRHAAVQFGAARGGSAAEPRLGGFCQLVRIVGQPMWQKSTIEVSLFLD